MCVIRGEDIFANITMAISRFFFLCLCVTRIVSSFIVSPETRGGGLKMSSEMMQDPQHPFCQLPGDPSLILTTNVNLGDKKLEIMKACSKAIASATGKPESYVAVSITDNAAVIFGGSDAPTALGCLYSIGSISKSSNGQVQAAVTDQLEAYGVAEDRIYINFFDMDRANVGWSRATFAG